MLIAQLTELPKNKLSTKNQSLDVIQCDFLKKRTHIIIYRRTNKTQKIFFTRELAINDSNNRQAK